MVFRRIKDLRNDRDLKQRDLAKYLFVDQSTYSDYETGEVKVSIETLIKLADFYNVSLDYLVERTDNPNINK
ncbi:MAG: helix-turn-helix domain-containing protein [Eubacterium sp.]